jgi:pimeloyl-ACP methyl ester carboxylesterase
MTSMDFARAVAPVLEEASAPVVIVGHSHGGRVAVCLATLVPEKVAGLVLVGAPVLRRQGAAKPSLRLRLLKFARRLGLVSAARLEAFRRDHGSADYRAAEGALRDTLVTVINESFDEELANLSCPVVLVWGSEDLDVPLEVAQRARTLIGSTSSAPPKVDLVVLDGVGHLVPTQDPAAVRAAIRSLRS